MQETSLLYKELVGSQNHWFEVTASLGENGRLVTEFGDLLLFGDTSLLVDAGGADSGFREDMLMSVTTSRALFNKETPTVGSAVSGEVDLKMINPAAEIPRRSQIRLFIRATNGTVFSEWIPKGIFYVDTREVSHNGNDLQILHLHGYDAMLMFEENYPSDDTANYPMVDVDMLRFIADSVGVGIDPRTLDIMDKGYTFPLPIGYSSREMLGNLAAAYGGNFIMSDEGLLLLVAIGDIPKETNYLVIQTGETLLIGGYRILV